MSEIGEIGKREWETTFYNLTNSRSAVIKIEHYQAVPFVISQADIDVNNSKV